MKTNSTVIFLAVAGFAVLAVAIIGAVVVLNGRQTTTANTSKMETGRSTDSLPPVADKTTDAGQPIADDQTKNNTQVTDNALSEIDSALKNDDANFSDSELDSL